MYREQDSITIANMEPMLRKMFAELADDVERTVPASGKFEPLYASFEDATQCLDITVWSIKVQDLIFNNSSDDLLSKRYLELRGYPGGNYCITRIVCSGSVKECAELLRSHTFVAKVMDVMKEFLKNCDDL